MNYSQQYLKNWYRKQLQQNREDDIVFALSIISFIAITLAIHFGNALVAGF